MISRIVNTDGLSLARTNLKGALGLDQNGWLRVEDEGGIASQIEMCELLYGFVRILKPALVVESGCHVGVASYAIGLALKDNERGKLVTSDIVADRCDMARERTSGLPVEVRHCKSTALPEISQCDLLFSDSSYESRVQELRSIKPGSYAIVHNTYNTPELEDACREFDEHVLFDIPIGFGVMKKKR